MTRSLARPYISLFVRIGNSSPTLAGLARKMLERNQKLVGHPIVRKKRDEQLISGTTAVVANWKKRILGKSPQYFRIH